MFGRSTIDAMRSGVLYGNAGMIDSMIQRMEEAAQPAATVVMTGGQRRPHPKVLPAGDPHRREPPPGRPVLPLPEKPGPPPPAVTKSLPPSHFCGWGVLRSGGQRPWPAGPPGSRGSTKTSAPSRAGKTWSSAVGGMGRWAWARARRTRGSNASRERGRPAGSSSRERVRTTPAASGEMVMGYLLPVPQNTPPIIGGIPRRGQMQWLPGGKEVGRAGKVWYNTPSAAAPCLPRQGRGREHITACPGGNRPWHVNRNRGIGRWNSREEMVSQETVYEGVIVNVRRDKARLMDGRITNREVVEHPGRGGGVRHGRPGPGGPGAPVPLPHGGGDLGAPRRQAGAGGGSPGQRPAGTGGGDRPGPRHL